MRLILDNIGIVVKQLQLILEFAIPTLPDLNRKIIEVGMRKMRNLAWFGHGGGSYKILRDQKAELIRTTSTNSMFGFSWGRIWCASVSIGVEKSFPLRTLVDTQYKRYNDSQLGVVVD